PQLRRLEGFEKDGGIGHESSASDGCQAIWVPPAAHQPPFQVAKKSPPDPRGLRHLAGMTVMLGGCLSRRTRSLAEQGHRASAAAELDGVGRRAPYDISRLDRLRQRLLEREQGPPTACYRR